MGTGSRLVVVRAGWLEATKSGCSRVWNNENLGVEKCSKIDGGVYDRSLNITKTIESYFKW